MENKNQYQTQVESVQPIPEEFIKYYNQQTSQQTSKKLKVICLIGMTGVGKSATANSIIGVQDKFKESASSESCTLDTKGEYFYWQKQNFTKNCQISAKDQETPIFIIDTPGLCDSEGRDTINIVKMVCYLKNISYINTFLICLNSQDPRIDENKQSILKLFAEMFGEDFYENVIVCFTRWSQDPQTIKKRNKDKNNEEFVISQAQKSFKDKINANLKDTQFMFIDNTILDPEIREDCDEEEIQKTTKQLEYLLEKTLQNKPFWCHDLQQW